MSSHARAPARATRDASRRSPVGRRWLVAAAVLSGSGVACSGSPGDTSPTDRAAVTVTTVPAVTPTDGDTPPTGAPTTHGAPTPSAPTTMATTSATTSAATLVFVNADVLTMDAARPRAQAIAVSGGRIAAVGGNDEIVAHVGPHTTVVDLRGATVLPGFVDSHGHRLTQRHKWGIESLEEAARTALAQGWTTLAELAVDEEQFAELRAAAEAGTLPIGTQVYLLANRFDGSALPEWYDEFAPGQQFGPNLRVAGLKVFIDFDSGRRLNFTPDELVEFLRTRRDRGWQISMKAIGQASHELALAAIEQLLGGEDNAAARFRLEHSVAVHDDQLARLASLGIVVGIQPAFPAVIWHEADIRDLAVTEGPDTMFRWPEYRAAGVPAAASPYNPDGVIAELTEPSHMSPMGVLYRAVNQIGVGATPPEPWMLTRALPVDELLPMLTSAGAYSVGLEDEVGTLAPGMRADLVVLSADPRSVAPERLLDVEVVMTVVAGAALYCRDPGDPCPPARPVPDDLPPDGIAVTASASLPGHPPTAAFDGDPDTAWVAGAHPEQWIQIDLGSPGSLTAVHLTVSQDPAGDTTHQVWVGPDGESLVLAGELRGETADGDRLEWRADDPVAGVRVVRVVTVAGPSWVAWREVRLDITR